MKEKQNLYSSQDSLRIWMETDDLYCEGHTHKSCIGHDQAHYVSSKVQKHKEKGVGGTFCLLVILRTRQPLPSTITDE